MPPDNPSIEPVTTSALENTVLGIPESTTEHGVPKPDTDLDALALEAFDKGIEEAAPRVETPVLPVTPKDPDGLPTPSPTETKPTDPVPVKDDSPPSPEAVEAAQAEIRAEAKSLGLKENSAATKRFFELSTQVNELKPLAERIPQLEARARAADEWEETVTSTKATPEQFGAVLGYLSSLNSGDPVKMRQGRDALARELKDVDELLGIESPGVDPVAKFADLVTKVESGELDRADALEIAELRQQRALENASRTASTQSSSKQQAIDAGVRSVQQLSTQIKAADPYFDARWPMLQPTVQLICEAFPPDQWAARIADAHSKLPAYVPPQAPARVAVTPVMRPGGAANMDRKPSNDIEAFEMGLQNAGFGG